MERLKKKPQTKVLSLRVPTEYYDKFKEEIWYLRSNSSEELWDRITQGGLSNNDFIETGNFLKSFRQNKSQLDKVLASDLPTESKVALQELLTLYTENEQHLQAVEDFTSQKMLKFCIGAMRMELEAMDVDC